MELPLGRHERSFFDPHDPDRLYVIRCRDKYGSLCYLNLPSPIEHPIVAHVDHILFVHRWVDALLVQTRSVLYLLWEEEGGAWHIQWQTKYFGNRKDRTIQVMAWGCHIAVRWTDYVQYGLNKQLLFTVDWRTGKRRQRIDVGHLYVKYTAIAPGILLEPDPLWAQYANRHGTMLLAWEDIRFFNAVPERLPDDGGTYDPVCTCRRPCSADARFTVVQTKVKDRDGRARRLAVAISLLPILPELRAYVAALTK